MTPGTVRVRDSPAPGRARLAFGASERTTFVQFAATL
ncbi:hypothetical protein ACFV23_00015 [Streptomyces sp. NPDC059627]